MSGNCRIVDAKNIVGLTANRDYTASWNDVAQDAILKLEN
jgi:hypothetical protein